MEVQVQMHATSRCDRQSYCQTYESSSLHPLQSLPPTLHHAPLHAPSENDTEEGDDNGAGSEREQRKRRVGHRYARAVRRGVTSKSQSQAGEKLDLELLSPMPDKPMMELKAGSNVWYQAYVIKESQNEAKVRFPCEQWLAAARR